MTVLTPAWIKMATEVIDFAGRRTDIRDFKNYSLIAKSEIGMSYYDRLRVADFLLENGVIAVVDERLVILTKVLPDWLNTMVVEGNPGAWVLVEAFNFDETEIVKFEQNILSQIGLDGENFFLEFLKSKLPVQTHKDIKHVSLTDDSQGFDIAAPNLSNNGYLDFWEVKTSVRPGNAFTFFLTRNEFETSQKINGWKLVAVQQGSAGLRILGFLTGANLRSLTPIDADLRAKWHSICVRLNLDFFSEISEIELK